MAFTHNFNGKCWAWNRWAFSQHHHETSIAKYFLFSFSLYYHEISRAPCKVTPLLSEFRLTNIVDRWIVQFACHVRRCVKQEAPSTSCAKLQRPAHRHCTRGQENSFRPFLANNRAGLVSFSNRAPLLWNSLPVDVREAPSPSSFKRRLLNILKDPCNLNKLSNICFNNPSIVQ